MFSSFYISPIGLIAVRATSEGITQVYFPELPSLPHPALPNEHTEEGVTQLREYFEGSRKTFTLPLQVQGTVFQTEVWNYLLKLPFGQTATYGAIAKALNNPLSIRAVGNANSKNPLAIIVPCHRIIGANGTLIGYAGGLWRKEFLLKHEGAIDATQGSLFL